MKKLLALLFTAALAASLVACGSVQINAVNLPAHKALTKGDTIQLTPAFASEKEKNGEKVAAAAEALTLEWATSNEAVATVDETGLVTAVGAGEADITVAISGSDLTAVCAVAVEVKAEGVAAPETLEFTVGDEGKPLGAKITPEDATNVTLRYESSDEAVATVDESGVVTPVAAGECVIKASAVAADDAAAEAIVSAETHVTVKAKAVVPAKSTAPSRTAPAQSVPAVNPAPVSEPAQPAPEPAQTEAAHAPDAQPEQPAPDSGSATEPSTPSGDNTASDRADAGEIIEGGGDFDHDLADATPAHGWD